MEPIRARIGLPARVLADAGSAGAAFALTASGEQLRVGVRARAGAPFELAERNAPELRQSIAAATGRPAQVLVSPRHDPLDVYA